MTRPKTLNGFKSRAKQWKRANGCTHGEALDAFAREVGFRHYHEALQHYRAEGQA